MVKVAERSSGGLRGWLMDGLPSRDRRSGPHAAPPAAEHRHSWWQVMCLTGVDYFSSLGYAPGIAVVAAGTVAPLATVPLVLITLLGALPVYRRVARESPHGQGSIAMLERELPSWAGKLLVLVLLGFAATDFVITITLSAADASVHFLENPYAPGFLHGRQMLVTLVLVGLLGAIFLAGFKEAIRIAVVLVGVYLVLNAVVAVVAVEHVAAHPGLVSDWRHLMTVQHGSPMALVGMALLVFPKLALGMSGFETGVAVMPLIKERAGLESRIRDAKKLLTTAAVIMSTFLLLSSFTTTVLIPQREFEAGGKANGRALAYLAHEYLGSAFGTAYDFSTILILWFAGASAMAGLLNLIPRYLPRYGMAPSWTEAARPLVLVLTAICFVVTWYFDADVDKQGGAYATGVLVLMFSAGVAVTLSARRRRATGMAVVFGVISLLFAYTLVDNAFERPDGLKIASVFIVAIIVMSIISRATRSTELRVTGIEFDDLATRFVNQAAEAGEVNVFANEPDARDRAEYLAKDAEERHDHHLDHGERVVFLEVTVPDASEFESSLTVTGEERYGYRILRVESSTIPNAIAAVLLAISDMTGKRAHVYFNWNEGNPVVHMIRYLLFGGGDIAPVTREVLRQAEPDPERRPMVHVG